jgi:hypothetical protein
VHKGIISAVKRVEFLSDGMSCIILRGRWCHIIVLNVHCCWHGNKCSLKRNMMRSALDLNIVLRNSTDILHMKLVFQFSCLFIRTFPIESLAHDSGRTLVRAEYGYPKGSPNTNS